MDDRTVKLVCFDLGRVLIRICDNWKHACQRAGIPVPTRELDAAGKAAMNELVSGHEVGRLDFDAFCRGAAPIFGLTCEQVRRLSDAYLIGPYPGVAEVIRDLRAAGVKTACLSNTNDSHWQAMCGTGTCGLPLHDLDYRFASQEIGARKPDAAIYRHVERVSGLSGVGIAFFDDMPANVDAAVKLGWQAEVIAHDNDPITQVRQHLREWKVV